MQKLPYILVIGDKEMAAGSVAVRARGNVDLGVMSLEDFETKIANDVATKAWVLFIRKFWIEPDYIKSNQALAGVFVADIAIIFIAKHF